MKRDGQVRVVGGVFRRTPISVVTARGLRPTPDRVRETLFNWIGAEIEHASCLDLFGGSGALGIEAASRGAREVVINEPNRAAHDVVSVLVERLKQSTDPSAAQAAQAINLKAQDALALVTHCVAQRRRFDLVFLDPPFDQNWLAKLEPLIADLVAPGGAIYVESSLALSDFASFDVVKAKRAGQVHYHLCREHSNSEQA